MNLNNLQIALRPRNNWEAFDLGRTLIKGNFAGIYRPWLYCTLPFMFLILLACGDHCYWAFFLFWLFLPIFERSIIYFLSRSVFGENPSCKEVLRAFPSEVKKGFFSLHFLWRLSLARSFMMPVWQLEGLQGKARTKRMKVLSGAGVSQNCGWNGLMFIHIEQLVAAGLITFCLIMVPQEFYGEVPSLWDVQALVDWLMNLPDWLGKFMVVVHMLSMILIRPFYAAGGFTLYLCRRMVLEGWDIELQFRSLAERLNGNSILRSGSNLLLLFSFLLCPFK